MHGSSGKSTVNNIDMLCNKTLYQTVFKPRGMFPGIGLHHNSKKLFGRMSILHKYAVRTPDNIGALLVQFLSDNPANIICLKYIRLYHITASYHSSSETSHAFHV